jgi:hypothetical protein
MLEHADAVSENGAAGKRAGRINRDHGDQASFAPKFADQLRDQAALAGARRPSNADHVRTSSQGIQKVQRLQTARISVFDQCCQARQETPIGPAQSGDEFLACYHGSGRGAFSRR